MERPGRGDDSAAQQSTDDLQRLLEAGEAMIVYVVSADSGELSAVWRQLAASPLAAAFTTAGTLVGVAALGYRGQLVEIDLTAALREANDPR